VADPDPAAEEYKQLREEKGADWRLITQIALTTLATTAAIAVGGVAAHSRVLVVLAPLPFYLGVWYLIQSIWLQNRTNTFIANRAPEGALNYELHVLRAREPGSTAPRPPFWEVSWQWWVAVAAALGTLFSAFPFRARSEGLKGFETERPGCIAAIGLLMLLIFLGSALVMMRRSEADRPRWEAYWTEGDGAPSDRSSRQEPQPPAK
jgi:hypothetical protein